MGRRVEVILVFDNKYVFSASKAQLQATFDQFFLADISQTIGVAYISELIQLVVHNDCKIFPLTTT